MVLTMFLYQIGPWKAFVFVSILKFYGSCLLFTNLYNTYNDAYTVNSSNSLLEYRMKDMLFPLCNFICSI